MNKFLYKHTLNNNIRCIEIHNLRKISFYCDKPITNLSKNIEYIMISNFLKFMKCDKCKLWFFGFKNNDNGAYKSCGNHYSNFSINQLSNYYKMEVATCIN